MFLLPTYTHFLECRIYHYRCRLGEAKTVKEFNFISDTLAALEYQLQTILN